MSVPAYADYKDSGVAWLGAVPSHWRVDRISRLFGLVGSGTTPSNDQAFEDGTINWVTTGELREQPICSTTKLVTEEAIQEISALQVYQPGTLLIAMYGATIGRLGWLDAPACTNQACCAMANPIDIVPRFAFYCLSVATDALVLLSSGGGQPNINQEKIRAFRLPAPPFAEQAAIATFLDRETAKIDGLVAEQERLIALLKEKRQAVISHAVTKGLNPNAPMKDSGIEWLGEIPAHWEVLALKHACSLLRDGTHQPPARVDDGISLLSVRNIQDGRFSFREDDSQISEADYDELCRSFVPMGGDVLLAVVGATLGKSAIIPADFGRFHIQRSVAIFRPNRATGPEWLNYLFASDGFQRLLWSNVGFSAQPGIYLGSLANFQIPIPPVDEQSKIVDCIAPALSSLEALLSEAQSAITLLQERRAALISAAVTGKIDVRSLVPQTPELETA